MPVASAEKVRALTQDFHSSAELARMLGVNRSQVTRWLQGAGIDPLNAEKIDLLEFVVANLRRLYEPEVVRPWLFGFNPHLGNRRPIDLVRKGRVEELLSAIRAERAGSFA
jgi:transcriptional regulator with XRE-family HTH domain